MPGLRLLEQLRPSDEDDRTALRRLCAGAKEAGVAGTDLWILDGAPAGVERIVTNILSQSANDFLVPSRIASDLTPRVRAHLGIRTLDTPGLEALFEKNADAIPKLEPTETEREAFLLTGLSDALLRRLPIHSRSDGSVGTAENVFREVDWPIPLSLKEHVLTIRPCQHPEALERQQDLIPAWSPHAQIETALSRIEPHVFRMEILDALGKLFDQNENLSQDLTGSLRKTCWLVAEGAPIAPQDILALPQSVDDAARAVLLSDGERPPFFPANKLPIDVREHPAFVRLEKHVLPDQRFSFDALTLMIEEKGVTGRLGEAENYPVEDFTVLANASADLVLPGWSLLAAILTSIQEDREQIQKIVSAFSASVQLGRGYSSKPPRRPRCVGQRKVAGRPKQRAGPISMALTRLLRGLRTCSGGFLAALASPMRPEGGGAAAKSSKTATALRQHMYLHATSLRG